MNNENETILLGFKSIFKIVGLKKAFFSSLITKVPIVVSFLIVVISHVFLIDIYSLIQEVKNLMISFLPGILGFTVAGYTLVVGFVQNEIAKKISIIPENKKYSLYQTISATFALNIITQTIGLIFAFFIHFVIYVDENKQIIFTLSDTLISIFNNVALFFILYWFVFTLFITIQVVINVFNFSQLYHYIVLKEKAEEFKNKNNEPKL